MTLIWFGLQALTFQNLVILLAANCLWSGWGQMLTDHDCTVPEANWSSVLGGRFSITLYPWVTIWHLLLSPFPWIDEASQLFYMFRKVLHNVNSCVTILTYDKVLVDWLLNFFIIFILMQFYVKLNKRNPLNNLIRKNIWSRYTSLGVHNVHSDTYCISFSASKANSCFLTVSIKNRGRETKSSNSAYQNKLLTICLHANVTSFTAVDLCTLLRRWGGEWQKMYLHSLSCLM